MAKMFKCLNLCYIKTSSHQWQDLFEIEESLGLKDLILLHHVQIIGFFLFLF